jgi:hypothetical protein
VEGTQEEKAKDNNSVYTVAPFSVQHCLETPSDELNDKVLSTLSVHGYDVFLKS